MLDYIFFNKQTCDLFANSAKSSGIEPVIDCEDGSFTVRLSEDSDENLLEKLEDYYDELLDLDQELTEAGDDDSINEKHTAGITVALKDGRSVYAKIEPELLAKVLQSISTEELNTIVCAITEAVENPDSSSLCQR